MNKMVKKILLSILAIVFFFGFFTQALGVKNVVINFFGQPGCPHCKAEEEFLEEIKIKYPQIQINEYSALSQENIKKWEGLCLQYNIEKCLGVVPVTFVNDKFFLGFDNKEGIGKNIENAIREELGLSTLDSSEGIYLPIIGRVDFSNFSLPALSVILGFFDGFNVCSLGALVLILSMVLALKSRKRVLIFGTTFILTTAAIYGILIFLWYKVFSVFEKHLGALQLLIGLVSLFGAMYFFKQFLKFKKQGPACSMQNQGISAKLSKRVSNSFDKSLNILTLVGIVLLFAFAITIVEFPCSATIPMAFAGTLANASLSAGMHFLYILIYIVFYLFDELLVFLIAVFTMKIWLASSRFIIWSALATSIILLLMSGYYILGLF
ncbi:MAG: hypothetical protein PHS27_00660 [Candidatus Pacebacteria bacterium]|nr:hypothetical protein [Candidatus Paceibacterota bacterium]